jgi:uncharacterized protein YjdB
MADCQNDTGKLIGRSAVLRLAPGCPDVRPDFAEFVRMGALTTKSFDNSMNSVTSEADDTKGFVENLVTNMDYTVSFDGEWRKKDKVTDYGPIRLSKEIVTEIKAGRQPSYWVMLDYTGDGLTAVFVAYMVVTSWSGEFGASDIATYSGEFKVADSDSVEFLDEEIAVTGVTVTPTSGSVAIGASTTFTVNVAPNDATDKTFTVVSSVPARATATIAGTTVTASSPGSATAGSANITVTTTDGSFTAVYALTVTA